MLKLDGVLYATAECLPALCHLSSAVMCEPGCWDEMARVTLSPWSSRSALQCSAEATLWSGFNSINRAVLSHPSHWSRGLHGCFTPCSLLPLMGSEWHDYFPLLKIAGTKAMCSSALLPAHKELLSLLRLLSKSRVMTRVGGPQHTLKYCPQKCYCKMQCVTFLQGATQND